MAQVKNMNTFFLIFIAILTFFISTNAYGTDAQTFGVDYMETFDNIPDWRGNGNGSIFNAGPNSEWQMYSIWGSIDQSSYWIANHGSQNVWQGTGKSLRMQYEYYPAKGPSRFGRYFGSGTPNSGYDEVYIFWMNKIPSNYFPKKSDGNYDYWSYYKYGAIMTGFTAPGVWNYGNAMSSQEDSYGQDYLIPTWKVYNYGSPCGNVGTNSVRMKITFSQSDQGAQTSDSVWTDACLDDSYLDKWFGLEFHLKLGTPGQTDGHVTIWMYDATGSATKVYDQDRKMLLQGHNFKWNYFKFGGNKSWNDSAYPNLNPNYHLDDYIINSSRIGPGYFAQKLGNADTVAPGPPGNLFAQ